MNNFFNDFFTVEFIIRIPAILLSLTIHEFFHGYVSYKLGDPTAKNQDRLTMNPLKHIDPVGFFMMLIFRFGWAKPVPINPLYYKNKRRGVFLVSLAGPLSNFVMAILSTIVYYNTFHFGNVILSEFFYSLVLYNAIFCAFNLLPIPPLDGSHILETFIPTKHLVMYHKYEPYGSFILLILIVTGLSGVVMGPILDGILFVADWIASFITIPF